MEKIELPKPKRAWWKFPESMRSPKWWLGFLYGVVLITGLSLLRNDWDLLNLIFSIGLAGFFGFSIAQTLVKTKDPDTLRVWSIGAILASFRTVFAVIISPAQSWLEISVSWMWDLFLGACMGYYFRKLPRLIGGSIAIGGLLLGLIMVALVIPTEYQRWGQLLLQQKSIVAVLSGIVMGMYGGGVFGMIVANIADSLKSREIETTCQSAILPTNLTSSLAIIPMRTAMLTYKGTGVVRFGALELQVSRDQYTRLKLGLTYKIEYHEHDMMLLGFELVSKEAPTLSQRIQE